MTIEASGVVIALWNAFISFAYTGSALREVIFEDDTSIPGRTII